MKKQNSFVAMFDILGFKALREKRTSDGVYNLYRKFLLPSFQHAAAGQSKVKNGKYVPDFNQYSLRYRIISDSIILYSDGDTQSHFNFMIKAALNILSMGFCGAKTPLRGAIGYGDLMDDNDSICVGSAIEDASRGETRQMWSGCSLTPTCEKFVVSNGYIEQYKALVDTCLDSETEPCKRKTYEKEKIKIIQYAIPEQHNPKTGPIEYNFRKGYVLNWTLNTSPNLLDKAFLATSDKHAQMIIDNTITFEKWARSQHPNLAG